MLQASWGWVQNKITKIFVGLLKRNNFAATIKEVK